MRNKILGLFSAMGYIVAADVAASVREHQELLSKWGVHDFAEELRFLPAARLKSLFHHESGGRLHIQKFLRNLAWQAYTRIRDGKRKPVEGNLRTWWYTDCKPPLSFLGLMDKPLPVLAGMAAMPQGPVNEQRVFRDVMALRDDSRGLVGQADGIDFGVRDESVGLSTWGTSSQYLYATMTDVFYDFVANGIFRFRDLGFQDDYAPYRFMRGNRPEVIFFAEKIGFVAFTKEISETFGCTAICLGGEPKFLSSEFFTTELAKRVSLSKKFTLLACVDYDPFGAIIAREFQRQLAFFGLKKSSVKILVTPKLFTKSDLSHYSYKLPTGNPNIRTITKNWLEETGGVNGKPYGIESDVVPRDRLRELVAVITKKK